MRVSGRRVLVTGASRGIGAEVARAFAAAGAKVALVARSEGALKELAGELDGEAFPTDLADSEQVVGLIDRVEAEAGPVDVLVNNAGLENVGYFPDQSPAEIDAIYRLNLLAPVQLCRQIVPRMIERGRGHIVNVSSSADMITGPGIVTYASTKAGLTQFTAGLRMELKGLPVKTTRVQVGTVPTDMLERLHTYAPMDRGLRRLYRLQIVADVSKEKLAEAIVHAVERERRHVRMPARNVPMSLMTEAPRRLIELALIGVKARD
jgi:short-subunit dehydrogenase